jgi:hypothetical protein
MQYESTPGPDRRDAQPGPVSGWGAEQLTPEELLNLGRKTRRAWDASVLQANRSPDASQMRESFTVAAEMCWLWGEVADELIGQREAERMRGSAADREAEAGS